MKNLLTVVIPIIYPLICFTLIENTEATTKGNYNMPTDLLEIYTQAYQANLDLRMKVANERARSKEHAHLFTDESFTWDEMCIQAKAGRINNVRYNNQIIPISEEALVKFGLMNYKPIDDETMKKLIEELD